MSRKDKLLERLQTQPKDFSWSELLTLMRSFDLEVLTGAGSARKFRNPATGHQFNIHQPHPSNILKAYQVRGALEFLRQEGLLK
jgi:hypothetical protein